MTSAALSQPNRSAVARGPAAAYRSHSASSVSSRASAPPSATGSAGGTAMPSTPGRSTARTQATGVETTGRPTLIASATAMAGGEVT